MEYRRLGKTNLEVSLLSFGTIKLRADEGIGPEQAAEALNRALDLGVNFVDTARAYSESESYIGQALAERRDEFYLATKTATRTAAEVRAELETSLEQLQMDYVDLYQLHTVSTQELWEQVMGPGGAYEECLRAREEGLIRHIGLSVHRELKVMRQALESGAFETIMVTYSVLDQEGVEAEILPLAAEQDLGVIAMKPLSGGQLVRPPELRRTLPSGIDSIVAGALRYDMANPHVSCIIPGMRSTAEVEQNVPLASPLQPLTEQELTDLRQEIAQMKGDFRYGQVCLRCGYCLPCPEGLNLPEIFRAADMYGEYTDETRYLGRELYRSLQKHAGDCVACRECVERCVSGLDIPAKLEEVAALFDY